MMTSSNGNIFRVAGLLWWGSIGHWWILLPMASDAELWCFFRCEPEQTVEQAMETPVIWDAITLFMMSLQCRHLKQFEYIFERGREPVSFSVVGRFDHRENTQCSRWWVKLLWVLSMIFYYPKKLMTISNFKGFSWIEWRICNTWVLEAAVQN